MKRWLRAAQVNRNLIIGLVVLAIIVVGFWAIRGTRQVSEKSEIASEWAKEYYDLWCLECKKAFQIPAGEAKQMNRDKQDGMMKCPECGQYTARWGGAPRGDIAPP